MFENCTVSFNQGWLSHRQSPWNANSETVVIKKEYFFCASSSLNTHCYQKRILDLPDWSSKTFEPVNGVMSMGINLTQTSMSDPFFSRSVMCMCSLPLSASEPELLMSQFLGYFPGRLNSAFFQTFFFPICNDLPTYASFEICCLVQLLMVVMASVSLSPLPACGRQC